MISWHCWKLPERQPSNTVLTRNLIITCQIYCFKWAGNYAINFSSTCVSGQFIQKRHPQFLWKIVDVFFISLKLLLFPLLLYLHKPYIIVSSYGHYYSGTAHIWFYKSQKWLRSGSCSCNRWPVHEPALGTR
jgi:hypothetical protein